MSDEAASESRAKSQIDREQPLARKKTDSVPTTSSASLAAMRASLVRAADEYTKRDDLESPAALIDYNALKTDLSQDDVEGLVWPNNFTEREQKIMKDVDVLLTYINLLDIFSDVIKSSALKLGVFWLSAAILYRSTLDDMVERKAWGDFDDATTAYLGEARETGSSLALLEPLVKSAFAKLMLNDRRAARNLLDEFFQHVDLARGERPAFDFPKGELRVKWIKSQRDTATELKKRV
jgi:hypothetical protein